jgi:hypothetical protein
MLEAKVPLAWQLITTHLDIREWKVERKRSPSKL